MFSVDVLFLSSPVVHVNSSLNRPLDRTWHCPPGRPRNKWLDQLPKRFHASHWWPLEACYWPWTWWCNALTAFAGYSTVLITIWFLRIVGANADLGTGRQPMSDVSHVHKCISDGGCHSRTYLLGYGASLPLVPLLVPIYTAYWTETIECEQLAQSCFTATSDWDLNRWPLDRRSNAMPLYHYVIL